MKSLSIRLNIISVLVELSIACNKNEPSVTHEKTTVEGFLLSAVDRSPLSYGKVFILKSYQNGSSDAIWYGRKYLNRSVLQTDENGYFSFSFKHANDSLYAIAAEADGFFTNRSSGGFPYPSFRATGLGSIEKGYFNYFNRISDEKDFHTDKGVVYLPEIRLAPKGWIKFSIKNNHPAFDNDQLQLGGEGSFGQLGIFSGADINTFHMRGPLRAGRWVKIAYNIISQGKFQAHQDSILLSPHDTITYEINF